MKLVSRWGPGSAIIIFFDSRASAKESDIIEEGRQVVGGFLLSNRGNLPE